MFKLYHLLILKQCFILLVLLCSIAFARPQGGGEIKLGIVGSFNSFLSFSLVGVIPQDYYFLVYDSLMVESLDEPGNFQPLLASSYQVKNNNIIVNLNENANWNNGEKITANDVIYTFEVIKKFGDPYYKEKLQSLKSINKINDYTVEFILTEFEDNLFNLIMALPIIYKEENADFISPSLKIPVVSGAYYIEKYKAGSLIVFKRNSNYWGNNLESRKGYFNFDKIYYHYVKTQSQLDRLYKNQEITFKKKSHNDIVSKDDKIFLKKQVHIPTFKAYFLNINGILQDMTLRKAIANAYDFRKIKEYFLNEYQIRLQSLFETSNFKDEKFLFNDTSNLVEAKNLMGGQKNIKLKILFKSTEDYKISQDFINNLNSIGFEVSYKILPFYDYQEAIKSQQYDIIMENLVFAYFPQDELISYFTASGEYNYSHINDKKITSLIKQITAKKSTDKEKELQELDLTLKKLYVYIPLYYENKQEYIYKNWLNFNEKEEFSIYRWWHR
ncbi:MAG: ABC transporter substrate-binding protein [Alphaproteobacteria bacterium]|jgi:ABC-type oligopeptide transport system substrate-binding subunit|nr:ABC transporter substrate-binding protein [Alphaproteobacteria bacterium]